jgi:hypothetical protein
MSNIQFTQEDFEALINIAERAPLQHMREAVAVSQLLARFKQWYPTTQAPGSPPAPPAA